MQTFGGMVPTPCDRGIPIVPLSAEFVRDLFGPDRLARAKASASLLESDGKLFAQIFPSACPACGRNHRKHALAIVRMYRTNGESVGRYGWLRQLRGKIVLARKPI